MSVQRLIYRDSIRTLNCKTSASVYSVLNEKGDFIGFKKRPNICRVPYCEKCEEERKKEFIAKYKPYFDAYPSPDIRHIICTVPVFSRSDLARNLDFYLINIRLFHEKIRKVLKYSFRAFCLIECHYQKQKDTYNFHCHYGVFNAVDIKTLRKFWNQVWRRGGLIVKYPEKDGKPRAMVKKYAFLEYVARRRVQQPRTMPLEDFYAHIRHRNLLKRIGFNKEYLAVVRNLRNNSEIPDGWKEFFIGHVDISYDLSRIEAEFRRRIPLPEDEIWDKCSVRQVHSRLLKDLVEEFPIVVKQKTLYSISAKIKHGN